MEGEAKGSPSSAALTLDTLRQRFLKSPPSAEEFSALTDEYKMEALLAHADLIRGDAPSQIAGQLAQADFLLNREAQQPRNAFAGVESEFTVCIGGKRYAPRMHSFHTALRAHYLETARRFAEQQIAYGDSLTALAQRLAGPAATN